MQVHGADQDPLREEVAEVAEEAEDVEEHLAMVVVAAVVVMMKRALSCSKHSAASCIRC